MYDLHYKERLLFGRIKLGNFDSNVIDRLFHPPKRTQIPELCTNSVLNDARNFFAAASVLASAYINNTPNENIA
ncbi:hypothetical protein SLA2020_299770 [Shorea laevis]